MIRRDQERNVKFLALKKSVQDGLDSGVSERSIAKIWYEAEQRSLASQSYRRVLKVLLSSRAASDLAGIADYTIWQFCIEQARRYRNGLAGTFERAAENPQRGRDAGQLSTSDCQVQAKNYLTGATPG